MTTPVDLDLDFIAHPTTGDVVVKTGVDAIKRSVRNLILSNFYDHPFQSHIGSNIKKMLFENVSPLTANLLRDAIIEVIRNYEPRVSLRDVQVRVSNDESGYDVGIEFVIINRGTLAQVQYFLSRIR